MADFFHPQGELKLNSDSEEVMMVGVPYDFQVKKLPILSSRLAVQPVLLPTPDEQGREGMIGRFHALKIGYCCVSWGRGNHGK